MLVSDFKMMTRPNCSLSVEGQKRVFALIALFTLTVALGFGLIGAWMVMPFAGLELLALAAAFFYLNGSSDDYESITIDGDSLIVETCNRKRIERVEFNRYWVRVMLKVFSGGVQRLSLSSHGREVEFGRYMNDEQRLTLSQKLKSMTGASYR